MKNLSFEIWVTQHQHIDAEIQAADRFAIEGRAGAVIYFFGKYGEDCAARVDNAKDETGAPKYKIGMLLKKPDAERPDALVIYTAAARNIDEEIKKDFPDAVDFSDPLYRYSREYIHVKESYCTKKKTGDEVDEIIKAAFYPREVIFKH